MTNDGIGQLARSALSRPRWSAALPRAERLVGRASSPCTRKKRNNSALTEVREGIFDEALAFALQANDKHGVRRTNEDKRNAMEIAWENRSKLFGGKTPSV